MTNHHPTARASVEDVVTLNLAQIEDYAVLREALSSYGESMRAGADESAASDPDASADAHGLANRAVMLWLSIEEQLAANESARG